MCIIGVIFYIFIYVKNFFVNLINYFYCYYFIVVNSFFVFLNFSFVCNNCLKKKTEKRKENKYNAKRLPTTKLGTYIETRVNNFLKKKEAGAGEVTVRVVSSSEKMVEVKPGMKSRYEKLLIFKY